MEKSRGCARNKIADKEGGHLSMDTLIIAGLFATLFLGGIACYDYWSRHRKHK
jgi:hypothetical protein